MLIGNRTQLSNGTIFNDLKSLSDP